MYYDYFFDNLLSIFLVKSKKKDLKNNMRPIIWHFQFLKYVLCPNYSLWLYIFYPIFEDHFLFSRCFFFQKILSTYFQAQGCKIRYVFGLKWAGSKELILYLLKCINGKAGEIRKLSWKNIRNRTAWQKNSRFGNSHVTVLYTVRLQRGGNQVSMYTPQRSEGHF